MCESHGEKGYGGGGVLGRLRVGWSRKGGLLELVAQDMTVCGVSASQLLMDSGQVCTLHINTPRYIRLQSPSICCLQKASMVLKHQSPSGSSRSARPGLHTRSPTWTWFLRHKMGECPARSSGLHIQHVASSSHTQAHCKKWARS